jgi:hypothetical protein
MGLEKLIKNENTRTVVADVTAQITNALIFGSFLDYNAGLRTFWPFFTSRLLNTSIAASTADHYNKIREYFYDKTNTNDASGFWRKYFVELAAFNTLPTMGYGVALGIVSIASSYMTDFKIDSNTLNKALHDGWHAYTSIVLYTPVTSILTSKWNDWFRKMFNVYTPAEKSTLHHMKDITP